MNKSAIYKFLFADWMFKDVQVGSRGVRERASKYNYSIRYVLLRYVNRWAMIATASFVVGTIIEIEFKWMMIAAAFQVFTSLAIMMIVYLACAFSLLSARGE